MYVPHAIFHGTQWTGGVQKEADGKGEISFSPALFVLAVVLHYYSCVGGCTSRAFFYFGIDLLVALVQPRRAFDAGDSSKIPQSEPLCACTWVLIRSLSFPPLYRYTHFFGGRPQSARRKKKAIERRCPLECQPAYPFPGPLEIQHACVPLEWLVGLRVCSVLSAMLRRFSVRPPFPLHPFPAIWHYYSYYVGTTTST